MPTALTSETAPLRLDRVIEQNAAGGWVALTIAPGKKTVGMFALWDRDLDTDLDALVSAGATTLAPLIEDDEMRRFRIPDLVERAEAKGLYVDRFPFHDGGIPKNMDAAREFIERLADRYAKGERLVVHCAGGLGRAGAIAACLRLHLGIDPGPAEAIAAIRELRSSRAIETRAQERFIAAYFGVGG